VPTTTSKKRSHRLHLLMAALSWLLLCPSPSTAQTQHELEAWNPAGSITVRDSILGCPEVKIVLPRFPAGEKAEHLFLLRSTTDLNLVRTNSRYPIARLPIQLEQRAYMDTLAPQNVQLYYQLETQTDKGHRYWSNVESARLPIPNVPPLKHPRLMLDKRAYTALLLDGGQVVRRFPIALGPNGISRKLHEDRSSTPEGIYHISGLHPKATYHRAIDIDYPNKTDQARYDFLASQGLLPYPKPEIGGQVQIHGNGILSNWTWGTIAMRNSDIDWLFNRKELAQGLEVRIVGNDLRPEDLSLEEALTADERLEVEKALQKLGYLTSLYSKAEWNQAISLFQKEKGLNITGILDHVTRARIVKAASGDYG
jgi:L,D-transpeptidase catalytic domain/Putative peptidoglycan binding domain